MLMQKKSILSLVLVPMIGLIPLAQAEQGTDDSKWYAGVGLGISNLDPDSNGSIYSVDDKSSAGFKLTLGYDWSEKIAIEGYYSDLGEATLSPNGKVSYRDLGASGLYYVYREEAGRHRGWEAFLKAGLGLMKNDSDVPYDRLHNGHVMLGLGGGYAFDNGLSLRADLDLYDKDSQFLTLNLIKRFGQHRTSPVAAVTPTVTEVAAAPIDSDGDGVADSADKCPDTAAGSRVNQQGCVTHIVLKDVRFEHDKGELTGDSKKRLDEVADSLKMRPDILAIQVIGHTDSQGTKAYNQQLSEKRAKRVREYLISKGIDGEKLTTVGMGESQPIADNGSEEGRRLNRRVELKLDTE
jgi:OmpA-OmpF porin, OOP family